MAVIKLDLLDIYGSCGICGITIHGLYIYISEAGCTIY